MDPWIKVAPLGTFSSKPPLKSSSTTTSCPNRSKCSATWDPMKPAPPVTRDVGIRFILSFFLWKFQDHCSLGTLGSRCLQRGCLFYLRFMAMFHKLDRVDQLIPPNRNAIHFQPAIQRFVGPNQLQQPIPQQPDPVV